VETKNEPSPTIRYGTGFGRRYLTPNRNGNDSMPETTLPSESTEPDKPSPGSSHVSLTGTIPIRSMGTSGVTHASGTRLPLQTFPVTSGSGGSLEVNAVVGQAGRQCR
jgi:hypothetical protein